MPTTIDKMTIRQHGTDEKLDRRVKLTSKDKERIRLDYFVLPEGKRPTIISLATTYNVHRRTIEFILFPERERRNKEHASIRQKEHRYYNRERGRTNMQEYRDYKRSLAESDKLKLPDYANS